jgi:hypothetical protein
MANAFEVGPGRVSDIFYAPCVASVARTVSCEVLADGTVTNEPILRTDTAHGHTSDDDTATDSENGPEELSVSVTTTTTGRVPFWIENPDPTATITVTEIKAT